MRRHEKLHQLIWGKTDTLGRSEILDEAILTQMGVSCLTILMAWTNYTVENFYRSVVYTLIVLVYYRSVTLYIRLVVIFSIIITFGDIYLPLRLLWLDDPSYPNSWLNWAKIAATAIAVIHNLVILYWAVYEVQHQLNGRRTKQHEGRLSSSEKCPFSKQQPHKPSLNKVKKR